MRMAEFDRLMEGEFGADRASWVLDTHYLSRFGGYPKEVIERGADLRDVWLALCDDFDVPEDRRLRGRFVVPCR
ncbi:DUF3046 domain-containing protein [Corynebacterium sp. HMSC28B08]|uniref:DUF3046 domain-containing protein n=1 Tax=Corynebacterium sp. HMSC28B08 TaxID=1581066 RepID=UPI0009F387A5|nr:DUF3046 domain-containing protein [Corynebacterium sp. HMSC28B08]